MLEVATVVNFKRFSTPALDKVYELKHGIDFEVDKVYELNMELTLVVVR